jgi:hypothetical protein
VIPRVGKTAHPCYVSGGHFGLLRGRTVRLFACRSICRVGPYNRCDAFALSSGRDRSSRPPFRPVAAASGRWRRRAVVSRAGTGRGAVRGRAACGHLAGDRGRGHPHCPDHAMFGLAMAGRGPRARNRHRPVPGDGCLLSFPVPQFRAPRWNSRRRAPGGDARPACWRRRAGSARCGVGTAVRSGHPGRGDRRRAADPAIAGPARAALRPGGHRGRSRVCRADRECRRSSRPVAVGPCHPGHRRRLASWPAGPGRVAAAHAGLGAGRRRAHGDVRHRGPDRRLHRIPGRTGRAADGSPGRSGDPPEYWRVGAAGGCCRLGLRRSRARRG